MEKRKIICDLVHGYIEISPDIEKIINNESFQRLKFISQLTANHLFPSANHTRFEHSLGVMKLSLNFFNRIKGIFKEKLKEKLLKSNTDDQITEYIHNLRIHLQYASLLHDVGHAPLSHVGEALYKNEEIEDSILELSNELNLSITKNDFSNGSKHELMSCYVIIKKFYSTLNKIFEFDFSFIFRIITGSTYSEKSKYWDKNLVINLLNSETIDVDKIDYLMRDNFMTGKVGPKVDIVRLIESLTITNTKKLSFKPVGLSALQKLIDCRDSLYLWVCNHHTVVYTDYLYQECFRHMIRLGEIDQKKYLESIKHEQLFSCDAICEGKVTDNEAIFYIRRVSQLGEKVTSSYSKKLINQLLNRNFLKPTWKTLFEYTNFVKNNFDDDERKDIINFITESRSNRIKIIRKIIDEANIDLGEIFIVVRPNKFYCNKTDDIFVYHDRHNYSLKNLLPQRDYNEIYDEIAFYIYCKEDKIENVKNSFINIMKNRDESLNV